MSCGKNRKKGKSAANPKGCTGNAVVCLIGNDVQTAPYTPSADSPVKQCSDLNCNFDDSCCWINNLPPADVLNWVKGSGQGEPAKMQSSFQTTTQPDGGYLLTASDTGGTAEQTAQMYSCQMCSQGEATVTLKHWQSPGMQIQVCQIHDIADAPQNCQTLPSTSGTADSVKLPKDSAARIAIIAKGFTNASGSAAIIDDIKVDCDQCQDTTTTMAPTSAPTPGPTPAPTKPPCQAIVCDFEAGNPCSYSAASGGGTASDNWAAKSAPYQNRLTGIPKPGQQQKFGACYTKKKGEKSVLQTNANFDSDYVVRFNYYKAVEGVNLKGCCDDESNCPYGATPSVQTSDYRTWRTASIICKSGTKKVLFVCENEKGASEGACGLDNIQLLQSTGGSPDDASQSACVGSS